MELTFEQRRFFEKRKCTIKENGVEASSWSYNSYAQVFLKFEEVGFTKNIVTRRNKYFIFGLCFAVLGMLIVLPQFWKVQTDSPAENFGFYIGLFLFCFAGFLLTYKRVIIFTGSESNPGIGFLTDPDKDLKLKEFMLQLRTRRNAYLLESYGHINKNLPYQVMYNQLVWLKDNEVISTEEWKKRIEELDRYVNAPNKITGFGNKN